MDYKFKFSFVYSWPSRDTKEHHESTWEQFQTFFLARVLRRFNVCENNVTKPLFFLT